MAQFESIFPLELLHDVAGYLQPSDMISLMRSSRSLQAIFEPILYRNIQWSWNHEFHRAAKPIQKLLISILRRPALALHIHEFHVWEYGLGFKPCLIGQDVVSYEDCQLVLDYLKLLAFVDPNIWAQRLCRLEVEYIIALILPQLKNVRKITINMFLGEEDDEGDITGYSAIGEILRGSLCDSTTRTETNAFARLIEFNWPSENFQASPYSLRRVRLQDMLAILQVPQLKTACLELVAPELHASGSSSEISPELCRIVQSLCPKQLTRLSLRYTTLAENEIFQVLIHMVHLEYFYLELYREEDDQAWDGNTIREALKPCHKTLCSLTIYWRTLFSVDADPASLSCLGSLKHFSTLKHIKVTDSALVDPSLRLQDILPPGIESLYIDEHFDEERNLAGSSRSPWKKRMYSRLNEFLPMAGSCAPNLKTIDLGYERLSNSDERLHEELKLKYRQDHNIDFSNDYLGL